MVPLTYLLCLGHDQRLIREYRPNLFYRSTLEPGAPLFSAADAPLIFASAEEKGGRILLSNLDHSFFSIPVNRKLLQHHSSGRTYRTSSHGLGIGDTTPATEARRKSGTLCGDLPIDIACRPGPHGRGKRQQKA